MGDAGHHFDLLTRTHLQHKTDTSFEFQLFNWSLQNYKRAIKLFSWMTHLMLIYWKIPRLHFVFLLLSNEIKALVCAIVLWDFTSKSDFIWLHLIDPLTTWQELSICLKHSIPSLTPLSQWLSPLYHFLFFLSVSYSSCILNDCCPGLFGVLWQLPRGPEVQKDLIGEFYCKRATLGLPVIVPIAVRPGRNSWFIHSLPFMMQYGVCIPRRGWI